MADQRPHVAGPDKSTNNERRHLMRAGALACLTAPLLGACTTSKLGTDSASPIATPKGLIRSPNIQSGQTWRYTRINRYNNEPIDTVTAEVMTVIPQLRVGLVDKNGRTLSEEIYDSAWSVVQEPTFNETLIFDKPVPLLPGKLAVGHREYWQGSYRLAGSQTPHPWQVALQAARWEKVDVPAGQFDALRIDRHIYFDHHDLFRHRSRRVDTLWYAPKVNRWVMREWTGFYQEDPVPFGLGRSWSEEREDAVRWVLDDYAAAPVA